VAGLQQGERAYLQTGKQDSPRFLPFTELILPQHFPPLSLRGFQACIAEGPFQGPFTKPLATLQIPPGRWPDEAGEKMGSQCEDLQHTGTSVLTAARAELPHSNGKVVLRCGNAPQDL